MYPKLGLADLEIGLIYGVRQQSVAYHKRLPHWGYTGMMLTDLELYEDYVNRERPDAYYEDQLGDVGTQCDGKDFLCESFCRSSAMNRAQRSNKMKTAAICCITWSSLCGLVWAVTPLVFARLSENALVQWYGMFEEKSDEYVAISRSDWDQESITLSNDEAPEK